MRPLNTFDLDGQDVALELGRVASVQMIFEFPGDKRTTGTALMVLPTPSVILEEL